MKINSQIKKPHLKMIPIKDNDKKKKQFKCQIRVEESRAF